MGQGQFIGEVAKRLALSVKAIRYYEGLGLLATPERTEAGYRVYGEQDLERLRFIKGAKALGLSLSEIKEIVGIWGEGVVPCGHVEQMLNEKLADLDRRIRELVTFRDALKTYMGQLDSLGASSDVPCKHIAGAAAGQWTLTPPEHGIGAEEKRER